MELEATTSLFYGFYNSIFLDDGPIYEYEMEELTELETKLNQELETNFYINYEWSDQDRLEYFNTVGAEFIENMEYLINYYIPEEMKQKDYYKLEIEYTGVYSPKYYNYTTDKIDYKIKTNKYVRRVRIKAIRKHNGKYAIITDRGYRYVFELSGGKVRDLWYYWYGQGQWNYSGSSSLRNYDAWR